MAEVEAVVYFRDQANILAVDPQRKPLATIGFAPLTSMFWFGNASERKFDDYRPEVHDSDGLLLHLNSGEMVWRPLVNGTALRHQIFPANNIKGFGLLQRDRNFSHYQDLFHSYQNVPSVWVTPHTNWGDGEVHLVELSTQYEGMDNVVAFWNPAAKPAPCSRCISATRFTGRGKPTCRCRPTRWCPPAWESTRGSRSSGNL